MIRIALAIIQSLSFEYNKMLIPQKKIGIKL